MAFSLECKRCGGYEAQHAFPNDYPGVCAAYQSPDPEAERQMWDEENKRAQHYRERQYRGPAYEH